MYQSGKNWQDMPIHWQNAPCSGPCLHQLQSALPRPKDGGSRAQILGAQVKAVKAPTPGNRCRYGPNQHLGKHAERTARVLIKSQLWHVRTAAMHSTILMDRPHNQSGWETGLSPLVPGELLEPHVAPVNLRCAEQFTHGFDKCAGSHTVVDWSVKVR